MSTFVLVKMMKVMMILKLMCLDDKKLYKKQKKVLTIINKKIRS